jgi:hypothetical protein
MSLAIALPQAQAQQPTTATTVPAPTGSDSQTAFDALPGRWVRVEGGYVITIKAVDAEGKLDASYENPRLLPFYSAVATKDGTALRLFFELRAGGYNGSTYKLTYDATNDRLMGVFDQVVAKQSFEVTFVRSKLR